MIDEELRREQRGAMAGEPPSRRRMFELTRLVSTLAACGITEADHATQALAFMIATRPGRGLTVGQYAMVRARRGVVVHVNRTVVGALSPEELAAVVRQVRSDVRASDLGSLRLPEVETDRLLRSRERTRVNVRRRPPRRIP